MKIKKKSIANKTFYLKKLIQKLKIIKIREKSDWVEGNANKAVRPFYRKDINAASCRQENKLSKDTKYGVVTSLCKQDNYG